MRRIFVFIVVILVSSSFLFSQVNPNSRDTTFLKAGAFVDLNGFLHSTEFQSLSDVPSCCSENLKNIPNQSASEYF